MSKTLLKKLSDKYPVTGAPKEKPGKGAKYRITIDFETEEKLPQAVLSEVAGNCFVQLESLSDGDLQNAKKTYSVKESDYKVEKLK